MNQELLALLGVIVTITLASAANLHLALNRLEDVTQEGFPEARRATVAYAHLLIALFAIALVLVVLKPILVGEVDNPEVRAHWEAAFNSGAIWIIALNILALMDLTAAVFAIPAERSVNP